MIVVRILPWPCNCIVKYLFTRILSRSRMLLLQFLAATSMLIRHQDTNKLLMEEILSVLYRLEDNNINRVKAMIILITIIIIFRISDQH